MAVIPFPVIAGPTAGGKSALAVEVALTFARRGLGRGEVVGADAFQVYRDMDIGTGKIPRSQRKGVPHHLIDLLDPDEAFSVHRWLELAQQAIDRVHAGGGIPIVAGGTHLYIKALLDGMFEGPGADPALRARLERMPTQDLRSDLERIDPVSAARIHPRDRRRTIRAIEVFRLTGVPISDLQRQWEPQTPRDDLLLVVLDWPAEAINRRINRRVREMVRDGLIKEVRTLWEQQRMGPQAAQALGYRQIIEALEGKISMDEAIERVKIETRRFAKNQRTWLRSLSARTGCLRLEMEGLSVEQAAARVVEACVSMGKSTEDPYKM